MLEPWTGATYPRPMKSPMIAFLLASVLWTGHGAQSTGQPATVKVVSKDAGYQLLRNGQPYFIAK